MMMSNDDQGMTPEQEAREKMRADFENHASRFKYGCERLDGEEVYFRDSTQGLWQAWETCAAQSAETIARLKEEKRNLIFAVGEHVTYRAEQQKTIARLEYQLLQKEKMSAAAQADNARLREAFKPCGFLGKHPFASIDEIIYALSLFKHQEGWVVNAGLSAMYVLQELRRLFSQPLDMTALEAYVAKKTAMINAADSLPEFLEGKDYSANVIARLEGGMLVIANRQYVGEADGWLWGVAYGSGCNLEELEPEADDDYKVIEWMPLPPAPDKQGE